MHRREFLTASLTASGGLMLGFSLPGFGNNKPYQSVEKSGSELNAWLVIEPDDTVIIRVAKAEMGQGVMTSLPMIVAEELEADWRKVKVEYANVDRQLASGGIYRNMVTESSSSISSSREYLQMAGAEARERLIKAAAERWVISPSDCYADYGRIYRRGSSDSFGYGELAGDAAFVNVAGVRIKTPEEFNILGLATPKLDTPAKVDGSAIYSMDVRLPDMVYATVVHCPVLGGRLRSMRFNAIRHNPGVLKAVRMESSVGVVAETFWQAKQAADLLPVFWDIGEAGKSFGDTLRREFFDEFSNPQNAQLLAKQGSITDLMDDAERSIESDYYLPYLAHAPMEPLNCTVHVQPGRVDVWVGHQNPELAARRVAEICSRPISQVHLQNCYLGGGFGRRSHTDFVEEATRIALEVDRPVQMIWTREEEMRAGNYRPFSAMRFKAGFDIDKNLLAFTNHSVTHSVLQDRDGELEGVDSTSLEGLLDHPYSFPAYRFIHTRKNTHMTSWFWRSMGHSINAYAMECFVDEMAVAAGQDPLKYRRFLLQGKQEYLDVLDQLEQVTRWGKRGLGRGRAMGMAIHKSFGTVCGIVAEVAVEETGQVRVDKVHAVVDCGNLVNPTTAEEQVRGGIVFGLTATLYGKLTVENGKVLEDNLDTYEILSMRDTPQIDVHWALSGGDHWGGLGEPTTPVIGPAVANALYKITGRRIRSLPIKDYYLRVR